MAKATTRATWLAAGFALALTTGSPAVADDVELLLSIPDQSASAKPNVLFILDSSGSMSTEEETNQEPYNGTEEYDGECDEDDFYWTTSSSYIPDCANDADEDRRIDDNKFVCQQGRNQIATSGFYSDTMAQYRKVSGKERWQELEINVDNKLVECAADSGKHGEGRFLEYYAQIGTNVNEFTTVPLREVAWGSAPTHRIYTVFSGNYLNWYKNPPIQTMTRNAIVKAVTKNVLGSIDNVNVGVMEFNGNDGGFVKRALQDLDADRAGAIATVNSLPNSGNTPLAETLYEAARYWHGMGADYGPLARTDVKALDSTNPMDYKAPNEYACSKNFVVYLTDGQPTRDKDGPAKVGLLPDWTSTLGFSGCTADKDGKVDFDGVCLPDIAEYLHKGDINSNLDGDQQVTTFTIGFTIDLPILKDTATRGGGKYYLADDTQSLTVALTDIVTNIFDRDLSFTAPAVAANTFNRTQHLNDLYVSVFRAQTKVHWPGNLKKYTLKKGDVVDKNDKPAVDPDTGYFAKKAHNFWNDGADADGADVFVGGAANRLPKWPVRNVYTNLGNADLTATSNSVSLANMLAFKPSDFGLTGTDPNEPILPMMIEWIRGHDIKDEDNNPTTPDREFMGDALHAQPVSIVYGETGGVKDVVVYIATNDGYLHAIDAKTGNELWTFLPFELLDNMADLYANETVNYKNYGLDGDVVPIVADRNQNGVIEPGTDFAYIVFGMRRGGDNYYALDVTNASAPKLKWVRNLPEFGQTWSPPVVARVKVNSLKVASPDKAVVIMGGGYDTVHDQAASPLNADAYGAGIFMLDLETGAQLWRAGRDGAADLQVAKMERAIPGRIRVLDMNGDSLADRMYAADLGGQIWRFDISNGKPPSSLVVGGVIAQFGAMGTVNPPASENRRFYTTPDVSLFRDHKQDRRFLSISIGSGYRAHPLDNTVSDRFYSLRDPDVFNRLSQAQYDSYKIAKDGDMAEVSGKFGVDVSTSQRGWKFTLPFSEKILSDSQTFDDSIYFVSLEPRSQSADPCQAGLSVNRLYRVNVVNGDPVVALDALDPNDPDAINAERVTELEQGGIAPKPSFLFPSPDDPKNCKGDECAPPAIACVGVECFDPGFPNNPVRTLWTQDGVD